MKFLCLATDYDGTLAQHGDVEDSTINALKLLRETGRKLVLVTGRELADLAKVCSFIDLFDRVVAENGALLHNPADESSKVLAPEPPEEFVEALRARGVSPLSVGLGIVATQEIYSGVVGETIRDLKLPLQAIPNKGALMVLPSSIDKASGLRMALADLRLQPNETIGVGDAENDFVFLRICGYSVAVANAIPALKEQVDLVTQCRNGAGVEELIQKILTNEFVNTVRQSRLPLA
jgi:hydroxymethylpyrimidine pyrophosphatase-like HAD family hydrolase